MADPPNYFDGPATPPMPSGPWPEEPPPAESEAQYGEVIHLNGHRGAPRPPEPFPATPIDADKLDNIPPRELIYGHFLYRQFVAMLGAPGGSGKTAYAYVVALAVASGRDFLSEGVFDPGNAWIYNLEDPETELYRRLKAAMIAHDVMFDDIRDKLFLDSGRDRPLIVATALRDGTIIGWPQEAAMIAELKARDIRVLVVDPFVRSHRVDENHNNEIDHVANTWARIADAANCAVLLVHHFRKGGLPGEAASFRGASALIDACRSAITITTMAPEEAVAYGISDRARWQYVRLDNAKLNLAPHPENVTWLRLVGVNLDNATETRAADNVQTVRQWEPATPWSEFPMPLVVRVLNRLAQGPGEGEQFYLTGGTGPRWAGNIVMEETGKSEAQAKSILATWKRSGLIEATRYQGIASRHEQAGMTVNRARVSEMERSFRAPEGP